MESALKNFGLSFMALIKITKDDFTDDRQGRTFSDVYNDARYPFADALAFFSSAERQQRMEDAEIHHDRAPLAGVVREFEAQPKINLFLAEVHPKQTQRFRQSVGVLVRMIMERKGWRKTGKKGSLGVRAEKSKVSPAHNTGGLAFWFLRAERYELATGMPFRTAAERYDSLKSKSKPQQSKSR